MPRGRSSPGTRRRRRTPRWKIKKTPSRVSSRTSWGRPSARGIVSRRAGTGAASGFGWRGSDPSADWAAEPDGGKEISPWKRPTGGWICRFVCLLLVLLSNPFCYVSTGVTGSQATAHRERDGGGRGCGSIRDAIIDTFTEGRWSCTLLKPDHLHMWIFNGFIGKHDFPLFISYLRLKTSGYYKCIYLFSCKIKTWARPESSSVMKWNTYFA